VGSIVTATLVPGARVGPYEVIERLGAGGMGVVYRARDTRLGRAVALKVLHPDAEAGLLHRLDREARAASALSHPNIVQIFDVGVMPGDAGEPYVVMELVQGETLRHRLARGGLPIPEVLRLGAQLTDGLAHAHRAGVLHRDLKPENLAITRDGVLKILDFGLAKLVPPPLAGLGGAETVSVNETRAGVLLGTLEYMSPEQATGQPVDARADQFAIGLILAEMATGQPVFQRATPAQVLAAVIEREAEPLRRLRPDAPEALEAIVSRCLRKQPALRFESTDDLAAEVASLADRSRLTPIDAPPPLPAALPSAVSGELVSSPTSQPNTRYHVQTVAGIGSGSGEGKIVVFDEGQLAKRIRDGKLTGVELVRRDDEERWQPLFESRLFRREVPNAGDPREAARWRALRSVGGHFGVFATVAAIMFFIEGTLPFWLGIWGAVLALQTVKAAPTLLTLLRRPRDEGPHVVVEPLEAEAARRLPSPAGVADARSPIAQEAARVRVLIADRNGPDGSALLAEVDRIVALTADLGARRADLEEQTSDAERDALSRSAAEAQRLMEHASRVEDRRLFERQLAVVRQREEAIAKAVRVRERLRVRQEMAEHQLKQLRLDLSRGAAVALAVPELSSRLESIRREVDARQEVEELDAGTT
jgi:serine/threonine protein kinase